MYSCFYGSDGVYECDAPINLQDRPQTIEGFFSSRPIFQASENVSKSKTVREKAKVAVDSAKSVIRTIDPLLS